MSDKPTGYTATCRCGVVVGAMDAEYTPRDEAARLLGKWLQNGCTVTPQFKHNWRALIEPCRCDGEPKP